MGDDEMNARQQSSANTVPVTNFWESRLVPFLEEHFSLLCICLVGLGCLRIIATYNTLSVTTDEPTHLACGMEFVANHVYRIETQHPPLSRMMEALGPYLSGVRPQGLTSNPEGIAEIASSGNVARTIFLLRLGNLPFFLEGCLVVAWWSRHFFGKAIAVVATGLFTLLPTVLADGGLATTDMALGANVGAAFLAVILWAEKPSWFRSFILGIFIALACLSKFTALGYIPAAVSLALAVYLATRWPGLHGLLRAVFERIPKMMLAAGTTALLIWAGYWFSFGPVRVPHTKRIVGIPAPEFLHGIRFALGHDRAGHYSYLLGHVRLNGWWYYFPVALAVKTPIAFLLLLILGTYVCLRKYKQPINLLPLAFSFGILLPALWSRIDIGIRHVEPIYIGLTIVAALGLRELLCRVNTGLTALLTGGALVIWMVISVAALHPDYLAYFNAFAGKSPETILVDSNYDWGQDLILLKKRLQQLGVRDYSLASWNGIEMHNPDRFKYMETWYGLPPYRDIDLCTPSAGWNVLGVTVEDDLSYMPDNMFYRGSSGRKPWYEKIKPDERVGGLVLYNIPPGLKLKGDNCP
jgi:hypothetical protein